MTYVPLAERAICPGCGAALELENAEAVVRCDYCGTSSRILLRLRRLEPELAFEIRRPQARPDPKDDFERWGFEQLLTALFEETDPERLLRQARALDCWAHARLENVAWLPALLERMRGAEPTLDRALAGVVGKMICSDSLELRRATVDFGKANAFYPHGTPGLLFALSLGDAATVKLLLEVADLAARQGVHEYSQEALIGVQTAIGREAKRRLLCTQVLLYRLLELSRPVARFLANLIKNQFDVGYTDLLPETLELLEDCLARKEMELYDLLEAAVSKCRRPEGPEDLRRRLEAPGWLKTPKVRDLALSQVEPLYPCSENPVGEVLEALRPWLDLEAAQSALKKFVWIGDKVPPALLDEGLPEAVRAEVARRRE